MQLGFVGLGRMGGSMVTRLLRDGHEVVAYARSAEAVRGAAAGGARGADSLEALVRALAPPRHVWLMLPAGEPTETTLQALAPLLARGDTLVDGGNTRWTDDVRRARELAARGLDYVDVGTSGGVWGLTEGYCLMVGGERAAVLRLAPVLTTLAPPDGWLHVGGSGSGHYVKMVHNGIEYALMQAYAEGFELMSASDYGLDLPRLAQLWNRGSVIRSWLLELTADALRADPTLAGVTPWVEDSGEGRWTVEDAVAKAVPAPTITAALYARFRSRRENSFADRLLAALRRAFGGHAVRR
ncbi:MAG TPA: decarboxylating 6-phosphogluconate dehydrogenase [Candidatus Rokubacteria bacterium]|nr:MAG: 6-phosphogluconate dehydrogenase (decarboxylating) [Candidatus Rokubacteria bacterium GWA2_73_35]HBH01142.1 decarboxylating 6-phosphogluconate dehydrogenase [Candidatus Rokubacteria bacterium]